MTKDKIHPKVFKFLCGEISKCITDEDRLALLKQYPHELKVVLDNDCSWMDFIKDIDDVVEATFKEEGDNGNGYDVYHDEMGNAMGFHYYHGWTDGVIDLFTFFGITAHPC